MGSPPLRALICGTEICPFVRPAALNVILQIQMDSGTLNAVTPCFGMLLPGFPSMRKDFLGADCTMDHK